MILNYIWISLILLAVVMGLVQAIAYGNIGIFTDIINSTFDNAKTGFELSIGLTGILALWMGIMKIGERAGAVNSLGRAINPFFSRIFPEIPKGHPVFGSMLMNISANMLGLDNAATPMGLKAMGELQELNTDKSKASNAMIMFVVLGASGLTLIPTTIMGYRATCGAANPADVFLPILIATYVATLVGLICVCVAQKIRLKDPIVLGTLIGLTGLMGLMVWGATQMSHNKLAVLSAAAAAVILLGVICWFVIQAMCKRINVYDSFIDGAKGGFQVAIGIIPYLIAILVAVGMFRASGAMELLEEGIASLFALVGINTELAQAVPTALMKPLSGSGARGLMLEAMNNYDADSLSGRLCCILQAEDGHHLLCAGGVLRLGGYQEHTPRRCMLPLSRSGWHHCRLRHRTYFLWLI